MVATNKPFARASHFNRTVVASLLCVAMLTGLTVACGDDDDADDKTAGSADTRGAGGATDELTSPAIDGDDAPDGAGATGGATTADTTTGDDATDGSAFADTNGPSPTDATAADTGDATGTTDTADTGGTDTIDCSFGGGGFDGPGYATGFEDRLKIDCPATPGAASFFVETAASPTGQWNRAYAFPFVYDSTGPEALLILLFEDFASIEDERGILISVPYKQWIGSSGPLVFDFTEPRADAEAGALQFVPAGLSCIAGPCFQAMLAAFATSGTITFPKGGPLATCDLLEFSVTLSFGPPADVCSLPLTLRGTATIPLLPSEAYQVIGY
jgi:hypothetical protein